MTLVSYPELLCLMFRDYEILFVGRYCFIHLFCARDLGLLLATKKWKSREMMLVLIWRSRFPMYGSYGGRCSRCKGSIFNSLRLPSLQYIPSQFSL